MASRTLNIAEGLKLPLDWLLLSSVVYGASGSGKTAFSRTCAEEAHRNGVRVCVIDLKGDFYGLKSTADGKDDGIPVVIIGGDHAELPLAKDKESLVKQAGFLAELIAGSEQSFILDLEHLSKTKQIAFLAVFFERLYEVNRNPLLLIMDEAQRYAPEKPTPGEGMVCLGAVEDIVKLGRKHGIGRILVTQRGSSLSKETSEICDVFVAFRTPGTLDQKRARDWFNGNASKELADEAMADISGLETGSAIFASNHPELRRALHLKGPMFGIYDVREPWTFDSSATPRIGKRKREPRRLAKADLQVLKEKMAEYIEEAEANDPRKLQAEMVRLRRELDARDRVIAERNTHITRLGEALGEHEKTIDVLTEQVANPLIEMHQTVPAGLPEDLDQLIQHCLSFREEVDASLGEIDGAAAKVQRHMQDLLAHGAAEEELQTAEMAAKAKALGQPKPERVGGYRGSEPKRPVRVPTGPAADVPGSPLLEQGEKRSAPERVLDACAWYNAIGIEVPTKQQVGLIAGYRVGKKIAGTYSNILGALRGEGLIDYPEPGKMVLTSAGRAQARVPDIEMSTKSLQAAIFAKLQPVERKVLAVFIKHYPEVIDKREAGREAGYTVGDKVAGTYSNILGRLHSLGMIHYPIKAHAAATPILFLEG